MQHVVGDPEQLMTLRRAHMHASHGHSHTGALGKSHSEHALAMGHACKPRCSHMRGAVTSFRSHRHSKPPAESVLKPSSTPTPSMPTPPPSGDVDIFASVCRKPRLGVLAVAAGEYATNKSFGRLLENAMSGEAQTRRHADTQARAQTPQPKKQ
jgi:hypothetical protein